MGAVSNGRAFHYHLIGYWMTMGSSGGGLLAEDQVRLVIHPETVNRYAY